jgi:hypothetical protein
MANRLRAANLAISGCAVCTDANGMLLPYTAGGGGGSIIIAGAGTNSTLRCGVGNVASGCFSFAGGGQCNCATGPYNFIGGGYCNTTSNTYTFIGGGECNFATEYRAAVIGGTLNRSTGTNSIITGGGENCASGFASFIGAGRVNIVSGNSGFVGAGQTNTVSSKYSGILAGCGNTISTGDCSFIVGWGLTSSAGGTTYTRALSKTSGTFRISHPDPAKTATKYLQHSFVESPTRGDNIYRYKITTCNCQASLALPDYYKFLNENDQVWVNPVCHFGSAYGIIDSCQTCVTFTSNCDGDYNVLVIGTRKDEDAKDGFLGVETWK